MVGIQEAEQYRDQSNAIPESSEAENGNTGEQFPRASSCFSGLCFVK